MKRISVAMLALALALLPVTAATADEAAIPELSFSQKALPDTEGIRFVKELKLGWNLGNTFDAFIDKPWFADELDYESSWCGVKTTDELLSAIKAAGFGFIRVPVSWHDHVSGEDFRISERWLARVKEVVASAIDKGLYVVLNAHHDTREGFYYPSGEHMEASAAYMRSIWSQLAEAFAGFDDRLIFESINEPRLAGTRYEWNLVVSSAECTDAVDCVNKLNQLFVDTVRAVGGSNATRYLLVPGYCASLQGATHVNFAMPADTAANRLILSVHAYTPYNFALQAAGESGSTDAFSIGDNTSVKDIDYLMETLYARYVSKGVPVLIGEFGSRAKGGNLQARVEHAAYYVALARANGISCGWWDNNAFTGNGELFGLFDRAELRWASPEILEAMLKYAE